MKLAIIGLGKMGANMARRLRFAGHEVVAFNRSPEKTNELVKEINIEPSYSLKEMVQKLKTPRILWTMVPAGETTENTIIELSKIIEPGDYVIDGGNSYYKDSIRRSESLRQKDISFLDVGVSGGIWGLTEGYSLMIGGEEEDVLYLTPIFSALAPSKNTGWGRVGPAGAGHYTKMIHNGIEYGMMEAIAEGFDLLQAKRDFNLDLVRVAKIWQVGSIIRSWLLDLAVSALEGDQTLAETASYVEDSGEGRWTIQESIDLAIPTPIITESLYRRFSSRQNDNFALKLLAAIRNKFGGHAIKRVMGDIK